MFSTDKDSNRKTKRREKNNGGVGEGSQWSSGISKRETGEKIRRKEDYRITGRDCSSSGRTGDGACKSASAHSLFRGSWGATDIASVWKSISVVSCIGKS